MAKIYIVNENDEIIGEKEREEIGPKDIYRTASVWITDSKGNVLLSQRALNKLYDPGKWGPAVAGTVEVGESCLQNALKESREELELEDIDLVEGPTIRTVSGHDHFCHWYFYQTDRPADQFIYQKEEIERIAWFNPEKLSDDLDKHPEKFLKGMKQKLELFTKK